MYGTAEIKKMDTKSIPFDFSMVKQMTSPEFLDHFQNELDAFLSALNSDQIEGN